MWASFEPAQPEIQLFVHTLEPYRCKLATMPGQTTRKAPGKVKLTVSLSRSSVAALDRISAKRLEAGASRREIQQSALIEEAIQALRQKEEV
jgi:hypothetical protein